MTELIMHARMVFFLLLLLTGKPDWRLKKNTSDLTICIERIQLDINGTGLKGESIPEPFTDLFILLRKSTALDQS